MKFRKVKKGKVLSTSYGIKLILSNLNKKRDK